MSCADYLDSLTELALGAELDARAHAHLAGCTACRVELERLRLLAAAVDDGVAELTNAQPSPGFPARVRARLNERSARPAFFGQRWIPALIGGLAVLALGVWLATNQAPSMKEDFPEAAQVPEPPKLVVAPPRRTEQVKSQPPARFTLGRRGRKEPSQMPEVLLAEDQWAQVVKLYTLTQQHRAPAEQLRPPDASPLEETFHPLAIAQIEIKPLPGLSPGLL